MQANDSEHVNFAPICLRIVAMPHIPAYNNIFNVGPYSYYSINKSITIVQSSVKPYAIHGKTYMHFN